VTSLLAEQTRTMGAGPAYQAGINGLPGITISIDDRYLAHQVQDDGNRSP
jgi:hypothetical protein